MKLADIGDLSTFRSCGKVRKVGAWSYYDNDDFQRVVYHYGTEMGRFYWESYTAEDAEDAVWHFFPTSVGWGSVSDQQGMNKILANHGWRYRRNGGEAHYERIAK
jgi:hypothetical protein